MDVEMGHVGDMAAKEGHPSGSNARRWQHTMHIAWPLPSFVDSVKALLFGVCR